MPKNGIGQLTTPAPASRPAVGRSRRPQHLLILDRAQHEATTTASRRISSPSDFLTAVRWALKAGFHSRANATTLRIAEMLSAKANRQGHLGYGRTTLAERLGLSVHCIATHTRVLRELGLLVWIEHGSKRNVLRTRSQGELPEGYRATGTIFALVVPPAYDRAHGRRTAGEGYHARVTGVTEQGRRHEARVAKAEARAKTTRPTAGRRTSPSRSSSPHVPKLKVGRVDNYTPRRVTSPNSSLTASITPQRAKECIRIAEAVQTSVVWLRHTCPRRLGYLLRSRLQDPAVSVNRLVSELSSAPGRPVRDPLAYLADYFRRYPTRRVSEADRTDLPVRWVEVPTCTPRPSPIPLRPLIDKRYLRQDTELPSSVRDHPELAARWEERQVSLAIARTLDYWRAQDAERRNTRGTYGSASSRPSRPAEADWIPLYATDTHLPASAHAGASDPLCR